ncbi:MAG TPA: threonine synthase [Desulfitobacteriaceae bacterium]|nr:threonine synthase [Desulfitobacteriaceae bacterium]
MYDSTRGNLQNQSASQAIAWGMVPGGGLFVPRTIPAIPWQQVQELAYPELVVKILTSYLAEFSPEIIENMGAIYSPAVFGGTNPAPLVNVGKCGVLELWHGPTAAFKDMALQVLPYLLGASLKNLAENSEVIILVATSGDTGKAALEGFKNVKGMNIVVFYPDGGVSAVQERQMTTTEGNNVHVVAVKGNFDDCQTAVKEVFASEDLREKLAERQMIFSSANSINWGRLLPQIVYYYWAYLQAVRQEKIRPGAELNVVVPTGNFGNILAAYYARKMGLPIRQLICASNKNNVLTDFFKTGIYTSRRPFYLTTSPSMDILISSNFERFLYETSGRDSDKIRQWFRELSESGSFQVDEKTLQRSQTEIYAGWADEEEVLATIRKGYEQFGYIFDPHTAVAVKVYEDYIMASGDDTYSVIISTASPFKFAADVLIAVSEQTKITDEWEALERLSVLTGWEIPRGLRNLQNKPEKTVLRCQPEGIKNIIKQIYNLSEI